MQTSPKGRAFIAEHEGVVLKTYRCPAGVLTIGVGHTARAAEACVRHADRPCTGHACAD